MSSVAVRVEGLGKLYRLGELRGDYRTIKDALATRMLRAGRRLSGSSSPAHQGRERFWALRNVSFEVARGEVVGIIGSNGAGKSTLLKILSRITDPTEGDAWIHGRVGCLLEVGTGFHPELTGRENTFLNGAILGMNRTEISRKFDEIVDFAEVERFIDTPVKHYSSGMYLRLAFAVAAHLEPEILIVDEVLAVGDAAFQKKCLGKMGDVARQGRTVIFVSHNTDAVQRLCTHSILLDRGQIIRTGTPEDVIHHYLSREQAATGAGSLVALSSDPPGSASVRFVSARYSGSGDGGESPPRTGGPLVCAVEIHSDAPRAADSLAMSIRTPGGTLLVNADVISLGRQIRLARGRNLVEFRVGALHLNPGRYVVGLWAGDAADSWYAQVPEAFEIEVISLRSAGLGFTPTNNGLVPCEFEVLTIEPPSEAIGLPPPGLPNP